MRDIADETLNEAIEPTEAEAIDAEAPAQDKAHTAKKSCDDATQEDDGQEAQEAKTDGELDKLTEALRQAEDKRDEYLQLAQRVQADFENFRRRNQNIRKEAFDDGARAFATTLLPVLDNLERAIDSAGQGEEKSLLEGVTMVERMLADAFEKRGITPISRLNEPFDPNLENAVMNGEPEDGEPGTVCAVLQKGYIMDGVVLRHAMVKVVPE